MTGLLERWKVGRWLIVGMFLSNIPTVQLSAQVGHDPAHSPFHDIRLHSGPVVVIGHLGADRGVAGPGKNETKDVRLGFENAAGKKLRFDFTIPRLPQAMLHIHSAGW